MKKVFFFGTGYCAKLFANKVMIALRALGNFQIMGFLDNNVNKVGTQFEGYKVYHPDVLKNNPDSAILLFLLDNDNYITVFKQLQESVPAEQIHRYDFPLQLLLQRRYKDSADAEIRETLKYISNNKISVFNQFISQEDTYDEVKWDRDLDLPYIDFWTVEGRKLPLFYPRNYEFVKKDGISYVINLLQEQNIGSPHLYIKSNHDIEDGDCIIDAGVCEGNFALKYIDVASHMYLFEMDPVWQEPLKCTFRNYEKKVTIIPKAVFDKTSAETCRIDDIVKNKKVDFVKMDVEGAETSALRGAEQTFCKNDIKSSICCYHRSIDEREIRLLLKNYGYQTSVSKGYMLFLYSDETWELGDLRHGIVYGER